MVCRQARVAFPHTGFLDDLERMAGKFGGILAGRVRPGTVGRGESQDAG